MVVLFLLAGMIDPGDKHPLLDKDIYMVSTVVLPKARSLPDKATAPKPSPAGESGSVEEPPIVADQMLLKQPKKERKKEPERTPAPTPEPKKEPKRPSRADLLANLNADESSETRFETSTEGSENATPSDRWQQYDGRQMTAWERRLQDRIRDNWLPGSRQGKFVSGSGNIDVDLRTVVTFKVVGSGAFASPQISHRSGDAIFDQSCMQAVVRTRRFDAPPEDPWTVNLLFDPADKL
jgi:outer membrane biosynthesis protein TonB